MLENIGKGAEVVYRPDEFVTHGSTFGPLCVFESLYELYEFWKYEQVGYNPERTNMYVFECEYVPSCDSSLWDGDTTFSKGMLPIGTKTAECVKIYGTPERLSVRG
jgi:hypothetical protein